MGQTNEIYHDTSIHVCYRMDNWLATYIGSDGVERGAMAGNREQAVADAKAMIDIEQEIE